MLNAFLVDFGSGNPEPGNHWLPGLSVTVALFLALYHVMGFRILKSTLHGIYSRCSWWPYLTTYQGMFSKDVQIEVIYTSILAIHHILGGACMAYGSYTGSNPTFIVGALISLVDDINDLLSMYFKTFPFQGGADPKLMIVLGIHHVAAALATVPAITSGATANPHIQQIGTSLLLAGGFSHLTLSLSRTRNRQDPSQATQDAFIWLLGASLFFYFRFVLYPTEMLAFYREEYATLDGTMQFAFIGFAGLMTLFNVLIFVDCLTGTASRVMIALKGGEKKTK